MDYICARNESTSSASILPARLAGKKETRNKENNNFIFMSFNNPLVWTISP